MGEYFLLITATDGIIEDVGMFDKEVDAMKCADDLISEDSFNKEKDDVAIFDCDSRKIWSVRKKESDDGKIEGK